MRLNGLGRLGLGLILLGIAGISGFVYDALADPTPGIYADLLGTNLDGATEFLLFAIIIMLFLLGGLFFMASKSKKRILSD